MSRSSSPPAPSVHTPTRTWSFTSCETALASLCAASDIGNHNKTTQKCKQIANANRKPACVQKALALKQSKSGGKQSSFHTPVLTKRFSAKSSARVRKSHSSPLAPVNEGTNAEKKDYKLPSTDKPSMCGDAYDESGENETVLTRELSKESRASSLSRPQAAGGLLVEHLPSVQIPLTESPLHALNTTPSHSQSTTALLSPTSQTPDPPAAIGFTALSQLQVESTIISTIYGTAQVCTDSRVGSNSSRKFIMKESRKSSMSRTLGPNIAVDEDVKKEAAVLRSLGLLVDPLQPLPDVPTLDSPLTSEFIDQSTCGLSSNFFVTHGDAATFQPSILQYLSEGKKYITPLHGEFETDQNHYLITGFAEKGDLYSYLSKPVSKGMSGGMGTGGGIPEMDARMMFYQLCQQVLYLHANSVAHLDISIENIVVDQCDRLSIIDFGLAAKHPLARSRTFSPDDAIDNRVKLFPMTPTALSSRQLSINPTSPSSSSSSALEYSWQNDYSPSRDNGCRCTACVSTDFVLQSRLNRQLDETRSRFPRQLEEAIANAPLIPVEQPVLSPSSSNSGGMMEVDSGSRVVMVAQTGEQVLARGCKFMLRPTCKHRCAPGKPGYSSPELLNSNNQFACFDAYKADAFALGVVLFILLTGVPPFTQADSQRDAWYRLFENSSWIQSRLKPNAKHYRRLSVNAAKLIDSLFKPQHIRPSIDQILQHPFFDATNPDSQPRI